MSLEFIRIKKTWTICRSNGFTLLEILLALAILSAITVVTALSFSTVVNAWERGNVMIESLHRGYFVMEQLVMGLRSAYYPDMKKGALGYGLILTDGGEGEDADDKISWVKLGTALVGKHCPYAGSPHRVEFFLGKNDDDESVAEVKSWRVDGQPDDFDPEDVDPIALSSHVVGFDCKVAYRKVKDEVEWLDEWAYTNKLPTAVKLSVYIETSKGEDPLEIKRSFGIPTGQLSWH